MTHALLGRAGYEVIEAANGAEAMRLAAVPALHFDLVLSDMVMPEMGGRALAAKIREQRPEVPVLLMSGYTRIAGSRIGAEPRFSVCRKAVYVGRIVAENPRAAR